MTEALFAVLIFALAAAGLGLGLALGRGAPRACGSDRCRSGGACPGCPKRRKAEEDA